MASPLSDGRKVVTLGHVSGVHGVKGWLKIYSLTEPREAIFEFQPWLLGEQLESTRIRQGKKHGKHLIAQLERVNDRDTAECLVNHEIAVFRDQMPELPEGEFYWTDLIGMTVYQTDGTQIGTIRKMLATGAHDVMVVQGTGEEVLIPFVPGQFVRKVDLDLKRVEVDWDLEFQ